MPEKQKSAKKQRAHKESKGTARGAKRTHLTELQKVLMGKGMGHGRGVIAKGSTTLSIRGHKPRGTKRQRRTEDAA